MVICHREWWNKSILPYLCHKANTCTVKLTPSCTFVHIHKTILYKSPIFILLKWFSICVSSKNIFDVNISSHTVLIKVNSFTTLHWFLFNPTINSSKLPCKYTYAFRSKISKWSAYSFDTQTEVLCNIGTHDLPDRYAFSPWACSSWLWTDK